MDRDQRDLEEVERHVRRGLEHIARQREIIAHFQGKGYSTDEAEEMLTTLLGLQRQHEAHREHLLQKLGLPPAR
ncbi:hypothetical protein EN873_35320 [bacterium M00.F.Ca.ET.230.01.1.1]|nr:hypothetical protein EN873_35320 [bacterium M00.F.Ca.ET.230.01.1.1]